MRCRFSECIYSNPLIERAFTSSISAIILEALTEKERMKTQPMCEIGLKPEVDVPCLKRG